MSGSRGTRRCGIRALWRRTLLFILNPRPPWWGRAWLWGVLGVVLLIVFAAARPEPSYRVTLTLPWSRDESGRWEWGDSHRVGATFVASIDLRRWIGGDTWTVTAAPPALSGGAHSAPTQAELHQVRRDAWQKAIESARGTGSLFDRRLIPGLELLRDGLTRRTITRPSYWVLAAAGVAGAGLLLLALVAWFLRASLLVGYRERLALAASARCPRCGYSLAGLGTGERTRGRCPECGVDVAADVGDAARELRRGP